MAIAFDAASSTSGSSVSSLSWSHTCTGSNLVLVVTTAAQNGSSGNTIVSSVTYNGVSLTRAIQQRETGSGNTAEIWYLVAPATGTNTIVVTYVGSNPLAAAGAISLTGVNQSTPLDVTAGTTVAASTISQSITTTVANDWIVDAISMGSAKTYTPGGSQTTRWGGTSSIGTASTFPSTTANSYTLSETWSGFEQGAYAVAAFEPAGGGGGFTAKFRKTLSPFGSGVGRRQGY